MSKFMSLRILDFFRPVFRLFAVDYPVMRKILALKLMMDQRRPPTILSGSNKKPKGNLFLKSLGVYALYGLILIPFLFLGNNLLFQMSILFGVSMFILMTTMISDFSSVLLDVRDKTILQTKPVSKRTISAARVVHIAIYMTMLTGAFIAIPALVILGTKGFLFFLLFMAVLLLLVLFVIALTALIYIFILRFFSGERLKDIINYMQIVLALGIIIGYQVLIRSFDFVDMDFVYMSSWWHLFIPPMWFGAPFEMLFNGNFSGMMIVLVLLAIILPIMAIAVYAKLMPSFERNLQKLMEEARGGKKKKKRLDHFWAKVVCHQREERLFFRFASDMLAREREFKLKVYPVVGMALVFPFIFMFNSLSTGGSYQDMTEGYSYFGIYFTGIMLATAIHTMGSSANYKGSWIFQATPVNAYKSIYSAALKAFLVKLFVPVYGLLSIIFLFIFSVKAVPDLLVALVTLVLCSLLAYKLFAKNDYPFSDPFESMQEGGGTAVYFLFMFVIGGFALVHFFIFLISAAIGDIALYVYLAILCLVTFFSWRTTFRIRPPLEHDSPHDKP